MNLLPLGSQAYQHLLKEILAGKRPEGERISEESIAMDFGISRTPAREALMRLSADGLVERTARKGCRIRRVNQETQRDLFECRAMLEAMALRLGFDGISIPKLKKIKSALLAAKRLGDPAASLKADEELHELILEACPNRTLAEVTGRLRQQCQAFRALRALSTEANAISEERLAIVRAILAGERTLAESLLSAHILQGSKLHHS